MRFPPDLREPFMLSVIRVNENLLIVIDDS